MEAAPKLILLFKDQECFSDAIFDALQPTSDSHLHRSDEDFQLSLEDYGITEQKACGKIAYFSDENGVLQTQHVLSIRDYMHSQRHLCHKQSNEVVKRCDSVMVGLGYEHLLQPLPQDDIPTSKTQADAPEMSTDHHSPYTLGVHPTALGPPQGECSYVSPIHSTTSGFTNNHIVRISLLLVNCYEPPLLSCVVNEILRTIRAGSSSSTVCLTVPCILPAAKLIKGKRSSVYGIHIGPTTKFTEDITKAVEKPPLSLQINYEPLACLLQFVNCLKFPTAVLIGERGTKGEHEVLHEIGEILARAFSLSFMKNKIKLNLREIAKPQEPWRALYG